MLVLVCAICVQFVCKVYQEKQDLCAEKKEVIQAYYGLSSFFRLFQKNQTYLEREGGLV